MPIPGFAPPMPNPTPPGFPPNPTPPTPTPPGFTPRGGFGDTPPTGLGLIPLIGGFVGEPPVLGGEGFLPLPGDGLRPTAAPAVAPF